MPNLSSRSYGLQEPERKNRTEKDPVVEDVPSQLVLKSSLYDGKGCQHSSVACLAYTKP